MLPYIVIIAIELALFGVLIACLLYFASMLISDFYGIPFVPTRQRTLKRIFSQLKITKKDVFYDLGCGDGRLVFFVNKNFGCRALGVELNPLLHLFSKFKARHQKLTKVIFIKKSFFEVNLSDASIIYLFLFPEVVEKLSVKLKRECRKGTVIISHGFRLKWLEKNKFKELIGKPFTTYYYRL